jgi:hypothetical protein
MNHSSVAKLLKTHTDSNNSVDYTPAFVNGSNRGLNNANDTGVGYFTDTWYGIHNPSGSAISVTVKTADQGTAGTGAIVRINAGETFYAVISKITVGAGVTVVLLGIPTTFSR